MLNQANTMLQELTIKDKERNEFTKEYAFLK